MNAVGLRTEFRRARFQEIIKELEKGQFQICYGGSGGSPSGFAELAQLDGGQPRRVSTTGFALPAYDRAIDRVVRSADEEEQIAASREMSGLARTYAPLLPVAFRLENDFVQPWVQGCIPPLFSNCRKLLDVDPGRRRARPPLRP